MKFNTSLLGFCLLLVSTRAIAVAKGDVVGAAVIGGATGLILGIALVLKWFVWVPLKKKLDARTRAKKIISQVV